MTTITNTTALPQGFKPVGDSYDRENFPGLHKGPAAGDVSATWSPDEGLLVYVGDLEGLTVGEARKLQADLAAVLAKLELRAVA